MFTGFPVAALDFYEDLEADNSKAFWAAHKAVYDDCVRGPMLALLAELEEEFGEGKAFRPYRDVRFSKDKSPYKTAAGAVTEGEGGEHYYVQISAEGLMIGSGYYRMAPDQLARFREAPPTSGELDRARAYLAGQAQVARQRTAALANELLDAWLRGGGLGELDDVPGAYRAVTAEQVWEVARELEPATAAVGVVRGSGG